MRTGTILLVHGTSKQAKIIQSFQKMKDEKAGYWNHSGIIVMIEGEPYVVEMAPIPGKKLQAAGVVTPLEDYIERQKAGEVELAYLAPRFEFKAGKLAMVMSGHIGKHYGYGKLIFNIPRSVIFNKVTDPKDEKEDKYFGDKGSKAAQKPVCHMLTMLIWNQYTTKNTNWIVPLFEQWYTGNVSLIYRSEYFELTIG